MKLSKGVFVFVVLIVVLAFDSCRHKQQSLDAEKIAYVDGLNKVSFLNRYKDPALGVKMADSALVYIADSLPGYTDGLMRAMNNKAFSSYLLSDYEGVDSSLVRVPLANSSNGDIEVTISKLLEARMAQRQCEIARSFEILDDIDNSRILDDYQDNYLFNFAQAEYYITQLILNYYYRNGSQIDGRQLLAEIEEKRTGLRCDYAQDMALNYAMAHSYYRLCDSLEEKEQAELLHRALELCIESFRLMADEKTYCDYQMADFLQLMAFIFSDEHLGPIAVADSLSDVVRFTYSLDTLPESLSERATLFAEMLFEESAEMFWQLEDPYQRLGAAVATAGFALSIGDTAWAHEYYTRVLTDSTMLDHFAPKFEAMLYSGLINSHYPGSEADYQRWFESEIEILAYISGNQKADFLLQQELKSSQTRGRYYLVFAIIVTLLLVALVVLFFLLRRKTRALAKETAQLQASKQKDVERIANVETCLSVLRHDINPFFSYLQNKKLPEELRQEVLERLVRTFDNIKHWTNISIPSGLQFRATRFALNEVLDQVRDHIVNLHPESVSVRFQDTPIRIWGDRQLMGILLRNLVSNALNHTEKGEVVVSAQKWEEDRRFVLVEVSDTGCGMTAEEVEDLFRTDKKPKENPNGKGYGFGLILARYIIKQHDDNTLRGCRIWAESEVGKGSRMRFLVALDDNPTEE